MAHDITFEHLSLEFQERAYAKNMRPAIEKCLHIYRWLKKPSPIMAYLMDRPHSSLNYESKRKIAVELFRKEFPYAEPPCEDDGVLVTSESELTYYVENPYVILAIIEEMIP